MSLRHWLRGWLGEDGPALLTEAEVIERVRAYAAANGKWFEEPVGIQLHRRRHSPTGPEAGHFEYLVTLGTKRPGQFVNVDATNGTVLEWRSPPR